MTISGEEVRALRTRMKVSEAGLAAHIGCNQSTVHRIENGAKFGRVIEKAIVRLLEEYPRGKVGKAPDAQHSSPSTAQVEA